MGAKGQSTNAIDFASWVPADRRWLMTGTPTPQTLRNTGIGNLFGLFRFLQHDFLCTSKWGEEVRNQFLLVHLFLIQKFLL